MSKQVDCDVQGGPRNVKHFNKAGNRSPVPCGEEKVDLLGESEEEIVIRRISSHKFLF